MEEASNIPVETPAPKHRGQAYTDFEKMIEFPFRSGSVEELMAVRCVTIIIYPEGSPQDEE